MYQTMNILVVIILIAYVKCETNEVIESPKPSSWLKSAQNILAGPAGQMVVQVAKELISRSTGNSQILSLNLSNLFILILLKILIFAAGMIGSGHWNHFARGADTNESIFSYDEPPLLIGYLAAQGSGQDGCLHRAACQAPNLAYEYARAAKALMKGIEMFEGDVSEKERYNDLIQITERGAYDGHRGAPCEAIYRCNL